MINKIWTFFIVIGIIFCIVLGNVDVINNEIIVGGKNAIDMVVGMVPIVCVWSGILNIASKSGLLNKLSILVSPILKPLFPDIDSKSDALALIASNVVANIFGLGSAATPFGLKAMAELSKLNNKSKIASRSMITFLVLNTSGLTIIPTTVISLRMTNGSNNPSDIIICTIISTFFSTFFGILMNKFLSRKEGKI